jgi:hypothetical protein
LPISESILKVTMRRVRMRRARMRRGKTKEEEEEIDEGRYLTVLNSTLGHAEGHTEGNPQ